MTNSPHKRFVDAVHGYISIPQIYCSEIIDTQLFQRLRRIEQTSMRPIFPCAHHDRFIHSIGTYHVGTKIFHYLKKNTENYSFNNNIKSINFSSHLVEETIDERESFWSEIQKNYELACLLHDCGHSPFSHTFEEYYLDRNNELTSLNKDIIDESESYINSKKIAKSIKRKIIEEFKLDLERCNAKPHELVSAWLVLHVKGFRSIIVNKLSSDPLLIARMIIGCTYQEHNSFEKQIMNCFISLLNGHEIDADRIDYAIRDKWATGLNTTTINIERLLSSIHINECKDQNTFVVCFDRKALPEIESLLDIKNYTSFWVFNHHKVLYHDRLLKKAVEKLALLFSGEEYLHDYIEKKSDIHGEINIETDAIENTALFKLLDYHTLVEPKRIEIKIDDTIYIEEIYLMSDDDIVCLLKKYFCIKRDVRNSLINEFFNNTNYAQEWLSRQYHLIPAWKSFVEYNTSYYSSHKEIFSINLALKLIEEGKPREIAQVKDLLMKNMNLKNYILELEANNNPKSSISLIIDSLDDYESIDKLIEKLTVIRNYYNEGLGQDFGNTILKVFETIKQEEMTINPNTYKLIETESMIIKEVKENSIFVNVNGNVICYKKLNLPRRNEAKTYRMFYLYLPRIYNQDTEVDKLTYTRFYYNEFRERSLAIRCPLL